MAHIRIDRTEAKRGLLEIVGSVDGIPETVLVPVDSITSHPASEWRVLAARELLEVAQQRQTLPLPPPDAAHLSLAGELDLTS